MSQVKFKSFGQMSFTDIEIYSRLPAHPIWSRVEELVDFSFADRICAPLYTSRGPRPYAPSLKFKIHIVQRYYDLSDREMEERVIGDLFIKRFLGLPATFMGMDHSTLGLDRERVGDRLFDACHHHILAQAKKNGLWGDNKEVWFVDSFHTQGHIVYRSSYRLIKQAILRLLNHLKRAHPILFRQVHIDLDLEPLTQRLPSDPTTDDFAAAFNSLVLLAYSVLHWFENDTIRSIFWSWGNQERQLASLEYQALLYRILTENVYTNDPEDPSKTYKKLARSDRPKDRIISAVDPDVRIGTKNKSTKFLGDKVQVVISSTTGMVLNAEPIAGNEPDGDRLQELIEAVIEQQGVTPLKTVADSAYGYGRHRRELATDGIQLVATVRDNVGSNYATKLFSSEQFVYDAEAKSVTCPAGQTTNHSTYSKQSEGTVYRFAKSTCQQCLMFKQCTTSAKSGRTVLISDYYEELQEAKRFNQTEEGQELLKWRAIIEPKNNEMKNHNGLGHARFRSRKKRRTDVKLTSIVVNLKQMVKQHSPIILNFIRKKTMPLQGTNLPTLQMMNG